MNHVTNIHNLTVEKMHYTAGVKCHKSQFHLVLSFFIVLFVCFFLGGVHWSSRDFVIEVFM